MKKLELKKLVKKFLKETTDYDYTSLNDLVIDGLLNYFSSIISKKLIKGWGFKSTEIKYAGGFWYGEKCIMKFKTPDGEKKIEVKAKLLK